MGNCCLLVAHFAQQQRKPFRANDLRDHQMESTISLCPNGRLETGFGSMEKKIPTNSLQRVSQGGRITLLLMSTVRSFSMYTR